VQFADAEWELAGAVASLPYTSKELRYWCAPQTILAFTSLLDEETLLFHAVKQARQSAAKIILVHVVAANGSVSPELMFSMRTARAELDRMARQLRWVGIPCEAIFLKEAPQEEICRLVQSRHVDRILMAAQDGNDQQKPDELALLVEQLRNSGVPVCVVGKSVLPFSQKQRPSGRVTLGLSLTSDAGMLLRFASRFAQEHHAHLAMLHVFSGSYGNVQAIDRTPAAIASRLPAQTLREAQLLCPLEIAVREGDLATELLKYDTTANQDFLILGSAGVPLQPARTGSCVFSRVVNEVRCPVIVLGQSMGAAADGSASWAQPKPPQRICT
jgi:nucleotide-binding universal stress UspA family protein